MKNYAYSSDSFFEDASGVNDIVALNHRTKTYKSVKALKGTIPGRPCLFLENINLDSASF